MNPTLRTGLACCLVALAQQALRAESGIRVLLIGNSQMQCYDLPRMLETMSASAPADHPRIRTGQALIGGGTLKKYWEAGEGPGTPRTLIAAGPWDQVVLQEIFDPIEKDFRTYASLFDGAIRKCGAKTLLFATANVTRFYYAPFTYPDSFKKLNDLQIAFGKEQGVPVAAGGYAWIRYLGPHPSDDQLLDLYHKDKGHPGPKGTYLYACLLYAHLTGCSPSGLACDFPAIRGGIAIPPAEAAAMQQAAWAQYQDSTR